MPPPRLVPLTRSKEPSRSTLTIDTPEPMLTSRHGNCGSAEGDGANVTENFGGSGEGRGRSVKGGGRARGAGAPSVEDESKTGGQPLSTGADEEDANGCASGGDGRCGAGVGFGDG